MFILHIIPVRGQTNMRYSTCTGIFISTCLFLAKLLDGGNSGFVTPVFHEMHSVQLLDGAAIDSHID